MPLPSYRARRCGVACTLLLFRRRLEPGGGAAWEPNLYALLFSLTQLVRYVEFLKTLLM